ncbi:MAG: glycosyltransferase [Peptococcaceae bacterium]|jgi:trehalose synthase|nr:glycosyltransferase [Peptococcaceae bacterium]MDH7525223.1 glycosyltransferase [Peptococcaceae bacterium]
MELVQTGTKKYLDYLPFLDRDSEIELTYYLDRFKDKKVCMVNSTAFGGGVAEILHSFVPLARDMGLHVDWWVLKGTQEFYAVTKDFHNCLQGKEGELPSWARDIYYKYNELNAAAMAKWDYDFIVVHDPQPAPLINFRTANDRARWIWRCHIDTSAPNHEYWDFLYQFVSRYDACVFTMPDFAKEGAQLNNLTFITPSIDPLSPKNIPLEEEEASGIISSFGVDANRPLIVQVSRFDPWKDPLGVIDVYKIVKKEYPSVQLALVGSMASDDPEGWEYLYRTLRRAGEDYDIDIVTNFNGVSNREVNAFQTAAKIIVQKSIREGFGLTVAEGMWKKKPVIGGNAGGIKLQIDDGENGYLVETVEECAERVLTLLRNPNLAEKMGEEGREKVRKNFLITTNILNYLKLFDRLNDS